MAKLFDKSIFNTKVSLLALLVEGKQIGLLRKALDGYLFVGRKCKCIVPDKNGKSKKRMLLKAEIQSIQELPKELIKVVENVPVVKHELEIDYSHYSFEQVMQRLLPKGVVPPASYEQAGHIARYNLHPEQLPYKELIGNVLLDKVSTVRTVVNKTSNIATEFRTFPMEVIAGESNMEIEVKECGAKFSLNYAQVYWNSRLQVEHLRMVNLIEKSHVVCDMMAGIGPFAVPLGKRGIKVYANDLNPKSFAYLKKNISRNRVESKVTPYNKDGRIFLDELLASNVKFHHVLMNLPASALTFLDAFIAKFDNWDAAELPKIHCYCFSSHDDYTTDIIQKANEYLNNTLSAEIANIHHVRTVAPNKDMYCLSFSLPPDAAFSSKNKRQRTTI